MIMRLMLSITIESHIQAASLLANWLTLAIVGIAPQLRGPDNPVSCIHSAAMMSWELVIMGMKWSQEKALPRAFLP
jgi:hypothetical protein